jgi:hypothetical protein
VVFGALLLTLVDLSGTVDVLLDNVTRRPLSAR